MARGLKFWIWEVEILHYPSSENKGADQLRGYREADLRLCFLIRKTLVFSWRGSHCNGPLICIFAWFCHQWCHAYMQRSMQKAFEYLQRLVFVWRCNLWGKAIIELIEFSSPIFNHPLICYHLSHDVRKPDFCICENKDADQLRSNREADQRLCFCHLDGTIPLLSKAKISSL